MIHSLNRTLRIISSLRTKVKEKYNMKLTPEMIEEILNIAIQYTFWIIVYSLILLGILIGLKLVFNINVLGALKKAIE